MIGLRYRLDIKGRVDAIANLDILPMTYSSVLPFTLSDYSDWRKDLTTDEWIYDPIVMVPQEISKLQAVSKLLEMGRYNDLLATLDADETCVKRILFDAAYILYRESNMVNEIGLALGFTSEDIDDLFIEANKILV